MSPPPDDPRVERVVGLGSKAKEVLQALQVAATVRGDRRSSSSGRISTLSLMPEKVVAARQRDGKWVVGEPMPEEKARETYQAALTQLRVGARRPGRMIHLGETAAVLATEVVEVRIQDPSVGGGSGYVESDLPRPGDPL